MKYRRPEISKAPDMAGMTEDDRDDGSGGEAQRNRENHPSL